MNTKIALIIGVVVIAGGGYYLATNESVEEGISTSEVPQEEARNNREVQAVGEGEGSFATLMERDENLRCTFTSTDDYGTSEGVFYYSEGKYRVEAVTNADGVMYQSNMIGLPDVLYLWGTSPDGEMAIMMPADMNEGDETVHDFAANQEGAAVDLDAGVNYDCATWQPDSSQFEPPADKEFMDMESMLEEMMGGQMPEGFEMPVEL